MGWGWISLVFALIFLLWGRWTSFAAAMAAICVVTMGLYSLYWFYGGFYAGARYYAMMLVPLVFFTAFGIQTSIERLRPLFPDANVGQRIGFGVGFLCLISVLVFWSWLGFLRYPGINYQHTDYLALTRQDEFRNSVVFLTDPSDHEYSSAYWLNDFDPDATTPLFARNLGPESNREIAEAYPGRRFYFALPRSHDNPKVRIVEGPLGIGDLK